MAIIKSIKLRVYPTDEQIQIIEQTLGTLRFLWNSYLGANQSLYQKYINKEISKKESFIGAYDYIKYMTHNIDREKYSWIFDISAIARQHVIMNAEESYKMFFKGKTKFPKFKSKRSNPVKSYYIYDRGIRFNKDNHTVWIPLLHELLYSNHGYDKSGLLTNDINIKSGRLIKDNYGRYFVSLIAEYPNPVLEIIPAGNGIGIDLGLKKYATIYNEGDDRCISINHPWNKGFSKLNFYRDKISQLHRVISMKVEANKKGGKTASEAYYSNNIDKLFNKVRKYRMKIHDFMDDFIKKRCHILTVKAKPEYITIEDLDVSYFLESKRYSHKYKDRIWRSNWYTFREVLTRMARNNGIELRVANKLFASTKICHHCGYKNKEVTLNDRSITCPNCGETYDRDENAAINLCYCQDYKLAY